MSSNGKTKIIKTEKRIVIRQKSPVKNNQTKFDQLYQNYITIRAKNELLRQRILQEREKKEKRTIEKYIKQLEDSIIDNETKYLQSTVNGGNILRGWEHIFTSKSNKIHMGNQCKKTHISNNERLFSQTFEFDKNVPEEILNTNDKIIT